MIVGRVIAGECPCGGAGPGSGCAGTPGTASAGGRATTPWVLPKACERHRLWAQSGRQGSVERLLRAVRQGAEGGPGPERCCPPHALSLPSTTRTRPWSA